MYDVKTGYPVYGVKDMWKEFVKSYLKANPEAWVKHDSKNNETIYKHSKHGVQHVVDYLTYKTLITRGNELYKKKIIAGEKITLLNKQGVIFAAVLDTNAKRFIPDWPLFRKTGVLTVIQNDTYPAIIWKKFCRIKNEKVYEFIPSRGNSSDSSGFVQMFYKAMREDKFLQNRYVRIKNK